MLCKRHPHDEHDLAKNLVGKVVGFHGKNGTVRVKFKKGVPGQALGTTAELAR